MYKLAIGVAFGLLLFNSTAMATCSSYPYAFASGTTADASQVNANFNCAALTSGATLNASTFTGATSLPGSGVIDSSGNVGVGTSSPTAVDANSSRFLTLAGPTGGAELAIGSNVTDTSGNTNVGAIDFYNSNLSTTEKRIAILASAPSGATNSGNLTFYTANAGTLAARMTINAPGNVGIGTLSPVSALHIVGSSGIVGYVVGTDNNAYSTSAYTGISTFWLSNTSTTASTGAGIGFSVKGAGPGSVASIAGISTAADYSTALVFQTRSSAGADGEKVRITAAGNVGIGTTAPGYTLHVNGSVAGTSAYNNLSDARLKKNVVPLTGGLALISQLRPVRFDWLSENERKVGKEFNLPPSEQIGFIAQDVGKVLPEAVSTAKGKDAIMSVAESKVVPVLVAAVKELKAANDNQLAEIGRLEAKVIALDHKVRTQTAQDKKRSPSAG